MFRRLEMVPVLIKITNQNLNPNLRLFLEPLAFIWPDYMEPL